MTFERAIGPILVVLVLLAVVGAFMWAIVHLSRRLPTAPNARTQRRLAWVSLAVSALWLAVIAVGALLEAEVRVLHVVMAAMFAANGVIQVRESDPRRIEQRRLAGPSRVECYFELHPLRFAAVILLAIMAGAVLLVLVFMLDAVSWRA